MNAQTFEYSFAGHGVTVIRPEKPNGEWIWKTEFLYAFDQAERALLDEGYTRVYYSISDRYGDYKSVRLMRAFYAHVVEKFGLSPRTNLFGFSRGALYAFNYALFYPETVASLYLDAPVMNMASWPPAGSHEAEEMRACYDLSPETVRDFKGHPIRNLAEYFSLGIPTLLVAGDSDATVPLSENGQYMIDFAKENGFPLTSIVKPGCDHHPHSLEDVSPILEFVHNAK